MRKHFNTMKRVAKGLKLSFMLLLAIVAYAAMLKRGRANMKMFGLLFMLGLGISILWGAPLPILAKAPAKAAAKTPAVPQGPQKQIFTRSNRTERSSLLGVDGQAAYIATALGSKSGILISNVESGSNAARFGITAGDVLLTLNARTVTTSRDADRILGDTPTGTVKVSFAHQSDEGLQLYNTSFSYSNRGAVASSSGSSSSSSSSSSHSKGGASGATIAAQIPSAESQMLGVINHDRAGEKAPPVDMSSSLSSLARAHAQDMATRKFFNHVNPDGLNPQDRSNKMNLGGVFENISFASNATDLIAESRSAEQVMMSEPPNQQNHRSNIIDPNHKTVGVGIAVSKDGVFYMVQEFSNGSP